MNVLDIQAKLIDNFDDIKKIMIELGFDEAAIRFNRRQHLITSKRPDVNADNPNGFLLYTNTLRYIMTTRNKSGNLFSLIMDLRNCSFKAALVYVCKCLNIKYNNTFYKPPFDGFYKNIFSPFESDDDNLSKYDRNKLPASDSLSLKFFKDGIALDVQEKWGIRYDHERDVILIPIEDCNGNLVGCKARNNNPNCADYERWFAYLPYQKTKVLYGWHNHYKNIINKNMVVLTESEKGPLQMESFNCFIGLGIGGHSFSNWQAKYIKSLMIKKIIVAFDEGLSEEEIKSEALKLIIDNGLFKNKVGYIYDADGEYLPSGSKASPTDFGGDIFNKLVKEKVKWIGTKD